MKQIRQIIHINIPYFTVAVERKLESSLQGRPVIVADPSSSQATVFAISCEVAEAGVRCGMSVRQARAVCGDVVCIPPRLHLYQQAVQAIWREARKVAPLIEVPDFKGHLYLDITGCRRLLGAPEDLADTFCRTIQVQFKFSPSWSLATNKLVAKVAMRSVWPDGSCVVEPGGEKSFFSPLPMTILPNLRRSERDLLQELCLYKIGQGASLSRPQLAVLFGQRAMSLYACFRGEDNTACTPFDSRDLAMQLHHRFLVPTNDGRWLERALWSLAERAGHLVRAEKKVICRVAVCIEYSDGVQVTRRASCRFGYCLDPEIFTLFHKGFRLAWRRPVAIARLMVRVDKVVPAVPQPFLFADSESKRVDKMRLFTAFDTIRSRYGKDSIVFGKGVS